MPPDLNGPDQYFSEELPPSRGQYKSLALLACDLLGLPAPESRLDASVLIARMRIAQLHPDAPVPQLKDAAW